MRHNLDEDWNRVVEIWRKWIGDHPLPDMALFAMITDLRKYDKGIDYPLRRLLASSEYGQGIRVYGAPPSKYPRYPFRWNKKIWALVRVKTDFCEKGDSK